MGIKGRTSHSELNSSQALELAQWVKCFLGNHEAPSTDTQHPTEQLDSVARRVSALGGGHQGRSILELTSHPVHMKWWAPASVGGVVSKPKWRIIKDTWLTSGFHTHTQAWVSEHVCVCAWCDENQANNTLQLEETAMVYHEHRNYEIYR